MIDELAVTCPECGARIGHKCKRPNGTKRQKFHAARTQELNKLISRVRTV